MASVPMTVAELRKKLAEMPDDAYVIYLAGGSDEWRGVDELATYRGRVSDPHPGWQLPDGDNQIVEIT